MASPDGTDLGPPSPGSASLTQDFREPAIIPFGTHSAASLPHFSGGVGALGALAGHKILGLIELRSVPMVSM